MKILEELFEKLLWNSRLMVVLAVLASMAAAVVMFLMTTMDVFNLVHHSFEYLSLTIGDSERRALRDATVSHVVEVVDGYLLATFMLIFALGLYELFISEIDPAKHSRTGSRILVIESLDDLKTRLAKVVLMILIVNLFEQAIILHVGTALDLVYVGAAIALVGVALYFTHASEEHAERKSHE